MPKLEAISIWNTLRVLEVNYAQACDVKFLLILIYSDEISLRRVLVAVPTQVKVRNGIRDPEESGSKT